MIGLFDSGHGGLTVCRALIKRFPEQRFVYLGDHANAPYGNRPSEEIVTLTRTGVATLFDQGCRLVILACNTATSVACRNLQQNWLPQSGREGCNLLGVIAPTVEAATQTPWAVTAPQYPQKYNTDTIAVFATGRTVASNVYPEEIGKRCPKVRVVQQPCPDLAGAIEAGKTEAELDSMVARYVGELLESLAGKAPDRAILGCTHYPLVETLFARHLPASTRLLSQPETVADSLEDYLARHAHYLTTDPASRAPVLLTTADAGHVRRSLKPFWEDEAAFQPIA